ncbi:predicted protein [Naegleria gruberi]|uniref:Predicted protein n=1 Tax=Naegleria gruberi TaxID=5762 RepID=D2VGH2_NAEGR|nr:uncharacterized protein NAEGRDRAFT_79887 [Naegleria gruberi]EFC43965.1 predicted protein [Naegleria gruberi]|eukprot:XP_002676709.1 predicted protein [Naegleria gruberi strain NEG-M]
MKSFLATLLVCLLIAYTVSAQNMQWNVCKRFSSQTLQISSLSISPDPPQAGNNLQVNLQGTLTSPMGTGATGTVEVQYAGTPMYSGPFDPCQFLQGSNTPCPLAKGPTTLSVSQQITPMAPAGGPYQGTIIINDENKNVVTCIDFNFMMN